MADERLLAPIRRFWSRFDVKKAYEAIFSAYHARLDTVTVIISKTTEGDSAAGQIVVTNEDYLRWMDALELRLQEIENEEAGITPAADGTIHTHFGNRYVST